MIRCYKKDTQSQPSVRVVSMLIGIVSRTVVMKAIADFVIRDSESSSE